MNDEKPEPSMEVRQEKMLRIHYFLVSVFFGMFLCFASVVVFHLFGLIP